MDDLDLFISQSTLLRELNTDFIRSNISKNIFRIKKYPAGAMIHMDGDICTDFELILSGTVVIERVDESGDLLTITEFYEDDILGGNLLFSGNPNYPMTITAKNPSVILEISRDTLFDILKSNPSFLEKYLNYISDHSSILGRKIRDHMDRTIRESVLSFLENEIQKSKSNRVKLNMTKKDFADKIGVSRTSLSRELSKMKKDGIIDFDRNFIILLRNK